jgi:hypothetical protein
MRIAKCRAAAANTPETFRRRMLIIPVREGVSYGNLPDVSAQPAA